MKNELYKAIMDYCDENQCWAAYNTVKDWNECLGTSYSAATFTSLVSSGHLVRDKRCGEKSYSYRLTPTPKELQKQAEAKKQREIQHAHWVIEHYDDSVEKVKARYEKAIRQAEEQLKEDLKWEAEKLAEAQELLKQEVV